MTESQAPGQNLPGLNAKKAFDAVVKVVTEDEPCYLLAELNLLNASNMARHRYQVLKVARNDRLVTAFIDLGLASLYTANEVTIPGGYVDEATGRGYVYHTVGELRAIADRLRSDSTRVEVEPSDMEGVWQRFIEERKRFKTRQSTFGYGGELVRSFER